MTDVSSGQHRGGSLQGCAVVWFSASPMATSDCFLQCRVVQDGRLPREVVWHQFLPDDGVSLGILGCSGTSGTVLVK